MIFLLFMYSYPCIVAFLLEIELLLPNELEQLEHLRSEDIPVATWLPILLSHIGSQVKRRQSQSYKFKEFAKIANILILKQTWRDTPSEIAW